MYFNFRGGGVNFWLQAPDQVPVSTLCLSVIQREVRAFVQACDSIRLFSALCRHSELINLNLI